MNHHSLPPANPLTPPHTSAHPQAVEKAKASYTRLFAAAASVTAPHGTLALASCSSHIDSAMFMEVRRGVGGWGGEWVGGEEGGSGGGEGWGVGGGRGGGEGRVGEEEEEGEGGRIMCSSPRSPKSQVRKIAQPRNAVQAPRITFRGGEAGTRGGGRRMGAVEWVGTDKLGSEGGMGSIARAPRVGF